MIDETGRLEPPTSDDRLIWDVWLSVYHFSTLAVADVLGVFPLLKEASASSEEVAQRLSLGPRHRGASRRPHLARFPRAEAKPFPSHGRDEELLASGQPLLLGRRP